MITYRSDLTQDYLKSILEYYPDTGDWFWIVDRCSAKEGSLAGHKQGKIGYEYIAITIDGVSYLAHRLAHLYMDGKWPENHVDHEDLNGLNNKWENIRNATRSQNLGNQKLHSNNTSGHKGVCWDKKAGKWIVRIQVNKKSQILGYFVKEDLLKAAEAYEIAALNLFKEFARF